MINVAILLKYCQNSDPKCAVDNLFVYYYYLDRSMVEVRGHMTSQVTSFNYENTEKTAKLIINQAVFCKYCLDNGLTLCCGQIFSRVSLFP